MPALIAALVAFAIAVCTFVLATARTAVRANQFLDEWQASLPAESATRKDTR
jgi:hypothetical protein